MYLLWYFGAVISKDCCEMPSLSTQAWLAWVLWNQSFFSSLIQRQREADWIRTSTEKKKKASELKNLVDAGDPEIGIGGLTEPLID
jgi:hypothetical protein